MSMVCAMFWQQATIFGKEKLMFKRIGFSILALVFVLLCIGSVAMVYEISPNAEFESRKEMSLDMRVSLLEKDISRAPLILPEALCFSVAKGCFIAMVVISLVGVWQCLWPVFRRQIKAGGT